MAWGLKTQRQEVLSFSDYLYNLLPSYTSGLCYPFEQILENDSQGSTTIISFSYKQDR